MTAKRLFLEIGSGNDLHGGDYTKAAVRAVEDAMHHSSLALFRSFGIDPNSMQVEVTIGVQQPDKVDAAAVARAFPYGTITVKAVQGGLDVADEAGREPAVIASAAVVVRLDAALLR
ncbi:MAG: Lin0512 family protein [Burkholderiales bacterium]